MPKRNYGFEKRQKELTKQRKKEEKRQRRIDRSGAPSEEGQPEEATPVEQPPQE